MVHVGFWRRMLAHNTDLILLLPVFYVLSLLPVKNSFLYLFCVIVSMLYEIVFIASGWQATPGKKMVSIKVSNQEGLKLSWQQSCWRTLLKLFSIPTFFIGYLVIALHPEKKALHDLLGQSIVIVDK